MKKNSLKGNPFNRRKNKFEHPWRLSHLKSMKSNRKQWIKRRLESLAEIENIGDSYL